MGWFQNTEVYEREITDPETGEKAQIWLRPLAWGDVLKMNEIKLEQDEAGEASARLNPGQNKLLLVELALVRWSLPDEITRETIRRLNPLVGEAIYRHVDVGEAPSSEEDEEPGEGATAPVPLPEPAVIEGSAVRTG